MSELSLEINSWIVVHQALVVTVGVPTLTALVAGVVSWFTTKANLAAQKKSRELQARIKIAEFRQVWINELRSDLSSYAAILFDLNDDGTESIQWRSAVALGSGIRMRMNTSDPDYASLMDAMAKALNEASVKQAPDDDTMREGAGAIVALGQKILKREWEKLKSELREIEFSERNK